MFPVLREQELFLECSCLSLSCCNSSLEPSSDTKLVEITLDLFQISKEQNPACSENHVELLVLCRPEEICGHSSRCLSRNFQEHL